MRITGLIAAATAMLAACGEKEGGRPAPPDNLSEAPTVEPRPPAGAASADVLAPQWDLQSSGEGVALVLAGGTDRTIIRLFCPAGAGSLLVNVPGFRPVGSEERLSFGGGGDAVALVADPGGDRSRGGVSGTGAAPEALASLIAGPVSASYGAQRSGPHPAPPRALASAFAAACREGAPPAAPPVPPKVAASPCRSQDGEPLAVAPLRAVGTEPFWGARIDGRCVTYSTPEDQKGTRVWTRYAPGSGGGGSWSGSLGGRPFELEIRRRPGCSDGMSDRRYPLEAALQVAGERRRGCAEPL